MARRTSLVMISPQSRGFQPRPSWSCSNWASGSSCHGLSRCFTAYVAIPRIKLFYLLLQIVFLSTTIEALLPSNAAALDLSEVEKKSLFETLMPSRCSVNCVSSKLRPVCGTDDVTYSSRCELKRAKKCDKKRRIKVKHKGRCLGDLGPTTGKCQRDLQVALMTAASKNPSVLIPKCNADGSYKEIQCHKSTGYCWCVTKDGSHIPGSSRNSNKKPRCKALKKRRQRDKGKKSKKKRACNSSDRQTFNTEIIKNFKEEYDRAIITPAPDANTDEIGTEKAIVVWKFKELDINKDGKLKFKEIRKFGRMVRKHIEPRQCAKRFLKYCDSKKDRTIDQKEWTLCLGVDIKTSFHLFMYLNSASTPDNAETKAESAIDELLLHSTLLQSPNMQVLTSRPSSGARADRQENKDDSRTCREQRDTAHLEHSQQPDAKHYIPKCTAVGAWEKAQCHNNLCWCVQETDGHPIPWTATINTTPNCTFDSEREMKGCPFAQKRRFLVDLMGDLTKEMEKNNITHTGLESHFPLREKVAMWKLKSLDTNNNGMLEKKEWRPLRRVTLKNKRYPRKCRRNFLRYCDQNKNKRISIEEWNDCLGLSNNYSSNLPLNPKRKGKNPFMDQLT